MLATLFAREAISLLMFKLEQALEEEIEMEKKRPRITLVRLSVQDGRK